MPFMSPPQVFIGVTVALSYVLSFVMLPWQAPMGGQISLEPVPILVLALWRGVRIGTLAGAVEGALDHGDAPRFLGIAAEVER